MVQAMEVEPLSLDWEPKEAWNKVRVAGGWAGLYPA